ncbi:HEPN domain-containing protein [Kitasatospora sp. NPDC001660]
MPTRADETRKRIASIKSELDSTYARYNQSLSAVDIALQEDLHKYMCIRMSGFLEQLMFEAISGYLASSTGGPGGNFAISWWKKSPNLTPEALEKLIARFGEPWASEIKNFLDQQDRRKDLGLLLGVRNKVAHGQSYSGGKMNVTNYKNLVDGIHGWVIARMIK